MKKLALCVSLFLLVLSAAAKEKKIRGYVTAIHSPTSFEIEDYRITRDESVVLDFEKEDDADKTPIDFRPEDIRVGTELEIRGDYDEKSGELRAKSIKVVLENEKKVKRTALMVWAPDLHPIGNGLWEGRFFADGQWIVVDETTAVTFKPNKSEREALKKQEKAKKEKEKKGKSPEEEGDDSPGTALRSLEQVGPNTFITYEGLRQPDSSVRAVKVEFMHNELEKGEAGMWKSLATKVKAPNFAEGKPGELQIKKIGKFKLVANEEAQRYVRELGERLIPPHQKALPDGDPNKIPFRFYLVQGKVANAFATPNGIVVVFSAMFDVLENEAQLATVMGHEIAHSIHEHSWRQHQYHRKKLIAMRIGGIVGAYFGGSAVMNVVNMIEGAIRNGYSRSLENQADRAGLGYMLANGYDMREAPRVWKQMTKKYGDQPTNFFWSSHDNHTTRRSYLMAELRMNYPDTRYESLATNEEQFQRMAELVRDATAKKKKGKVKVKM